MKVCTNNSTNCNLAIMFLMIIIYYIFLLLLAVPIEESSSVYTNQFTYQIDTASTGQISTTFTNFVVTSSYSASMHSSKDIFDTSIATTPNDIVITTNHSALHNSNDIIETSIVVTTLNQPNITKPQSKKYICLYQLCMYIEYTSFINANNNNTIIIYITCYNAISSYPIIVIIVIGAIVMCLLIISLTALMALVMLYVKKNHRKGMVSY